VQYLDLNTLQESKIARYPLFIEKEWKKVTVIKPLPTWLSESGDRKERASRFVSG
jgi:hypothetical protein